MDSGETADSGPRDRTLVSLKRFSLAILGTRGVPPRYGGFETFAGELGRRLVARGHDVTVYCRSSLYPERPSSWKGVSRIDLPAVEHKYLETVSHSLVSALDALRRDYDVVLVCNAANAFVLPLLKAAGIPVAINVDGIERRRRKWNVLGRSVYAVGEAMSVSFADALVADARVIAEYYAAEYGAPSEVIAYGADFPEEADTDVLARLGLSPGGYVLYVSRFEPENNPLEVIGHYRRAGIAWPLVMVGSASYDETLRRALDQAGGDDVILPGAIYGADYRTLQRNAGVYVQATEVGGIHPALIEAMGSGGAVLALDTPENREAGGDAVDYFRFEGSSSLEKKLRDWMDAPAAASVYRSRARARVAARYSWEAVTDEYEALLGSLAGRDRTR